MASTMCSRRAQGSMPSSRDGAEPHMYKEATFALAITPIGASQDG